MPDSEDSNIFATFTSENAATFENPPIIDYTDGFLSIQSASIPMDPLAAIFNNPSKGHLYVTIPESLAKNLDSLNVDAASGSLDIANLISDYASFQIASGTTNLNNLQVNTLDLNVSSGKTTFQGHVAEDLFAHLGSGNLSVSSNTCPGTMTVDMLSGMIELFLPEDSAIEANIGQASGSFANHLPTAGSEANATSQLYANIASGALVINSV